MPKCFIIQPFDSGGKFDKRFNDIYKPALKEVGLEPYRVDQDPDADILIKSIEEGIRDATICFADITRDNPNVWYELGYANATRCPVILVCSTKREKFPFDIQHRKIIQYDSESTSDFEDLKNAIIERAKALQKRAATRKFVQSEQVAPQDGLSQIEIQLLAMLAAESILPDNPVSKYSLENMANDYGMTLVGLGLAVQRLQKKEFIKTYQDGDPFTGGIDNQLVFLEEEGWNWIHENDHMFRLEEDDQDEDSPDPDNVLPF